MNTGSRERINRIIACYEALVRLEGSSGKSTYFQKRLKWWKRELKEDYLSSE